MGYEFPAPSSEATPVLLRKSSTYSRAARKPSRQDMRRRQSEMQSSSPTSPGSPPPLYGRDGSQFSSLSQIKGLAKGVRGMRQRANGVRERRRRKSEASAPKIKLQTLTEQEIERLTGVHMKLSKQWDGCPTAQWQLSAVLLHSGLALPDDPEIEGFMERVGLNAPANATAALPARKVLEVAELLKRQYLKVQEEDTHTDVVDAFTALGGSPVPMGTLCLSAVQERLDGEGAMLADVMDAFVEHTGIGEEQDLDFKTFGELLGVHDQALIEAYVALGGQRDLKGEIPIDKVKERVADFGLEKDAVETFVNSLDKDGDGQLDFEEFRIMVKEYDLSITGLASPMGSPSAAGKWGDDSNKEESGRPVREEEEGEDGGSPRRVQITGDTPDFQMIDPDEEEEEGLESEGVMTPTAPKSTQSFVRKNFLHKVAGTINTLSGPVKDPNADRIVILSESGQNIVIDSERLRGALNGIVGKHHSDRLCRLRKLRTDGRFFNPSQLHRLNRKISLLERSLNLAEDSETASTGRRASGISASASLPKTQGMESPPDPHPPQKLQPSPPRDGNPGQQASRKQPGERRRRPPFPGSTRRSPTRSPASPRGGGGPRRKPEGRMSPERERFDTPSPVSIGLRTSIEELFVLARGEADPKGTPESGVEAAANVPAAPEPPSLATGIAGAGCTPLMNEDGSRGYTSAYAPHPGQEPSPVVGYYPIAGEPDPQVEAPQQEHQQAYQRLPTGFYSGHPEYPDARASASPPLPSHSPPPSSRSRPPHLLGMTAEGGGWAEHPITEQPPAAPSPLGRAISDSAQEGARAWLALQNHAAPLPTPAPRSPPHKRSLVGSKRPSTARNPRIGSASSRQPKPRRSSYMPRSSQGTHMAGPISHSARKARPAVRSSSSFSGDSELASPQGAGSHWEFHPPPRPPLTSPRRVASAPRQRQGSARASTHRTPAAPAAPPSAPPPARRRPHTAGTGGVRGERGGTHAPPKDSYPFPLFSDLTEATWTPRSAMGVERVDDEGLFTGDGPWPISSLASGY